MAITRRSFLKGVATTSAASVIGQAYWRQLLQTQLSRLVLGK